MVMTHLFIIRYFFFSMRDVNVIHTQYDCGISLAAYNN